MYNFSSSELSIEAKSQQEKFGRWYNITYGKKTKRIWIGLYLLEQNPNRSFYMYQFQKDAVTNKTEKYIENTDFFIYGEGEVYIPITDENNEIPEFLFSKNTDDQQQKFNSLIELNIKKFFEIVE